MRTRNRATFVDSWPVLVTFALTTILHVAAALLSDVWITTDLDAQPIWLATGISVGVAISANRWPPRLAALAGGVLGHAMYLLVGSAELDTALASMAAHTIEAAVATGAILRLFTSKTSHFAPGPSKSFFAQLLCIAAAAIASIPIMIEAGRTDLSAGWTLAHGVGTFAVSAAMVVGRAGWLSTAHPWRHRREFLITIAAFIALALLSFSLDNSIIYVVMGGVLLVTARFGTRIGQPLALLLICAAALETSLGRGAFTVDGMADIYSIQAFAGSTAVATAMVGRLAFLSDKELLRKQRTADRWQKLARSGFDAFIEVDANRLIVDASEGITHLTGIPEERLRGLQFRALFDSAGWAQVEHFVALVIKGESVRFDRSFVDASGETRWALASVDPQMTDSGVFDGCTIFLLDTTATHRLNAERVETRVALAAAQESERRRLAQLVHDGALQDFAAANLLVGAAGLDPTLQHDATHLERIEILLSSGMSKLRADAIGSEVIDLREVVVTEALEKTVAKFALLNSAEVRIREHRLVDATPTLAGTIFQITQEALVNAMVHSGATLIEVDIRRTRDGYSITIVDNGVGFDSSRLPEVGHLGLSNMTALAYQAGGWCSLSTRAGGGTRIEAWVPLRSSQSDAVLLGPVS